MELVLIRHGIAEERAGEMPDADRRLTRKGRRRLETALPAYCLLLHQKQLRVWSSPLARARETADLLAAALASGPVETFDAIADGSLEPLLNQLDGSGPDDCIVVVGHQPYLGAWSRQLCGLELPFRKGAAAAFRLDPPSAGRGDLLWFLQPGPLRRIGRRF